MIKVLTIEREYGSGAATIAHAPAHATTGPLCNKSPAVTATRAVAARSMLVRVGWTCTEGRAYPRRR